MIIFIFPLLFHIENISLLLKKGLNCSSYINHLLIILISWMLLDIIVFTHPEKYDGDHKRSNIMTLYFKSLFYFMIVALNFVKKNKNWNYPLYPCLANKRALKIDFTFDKTFLILMGIFF